MAKIFTKAIVEKLLKNGSASAASEGGIDHQPVIKIFNPWGGQTWLLSEIDPHNPDIAFGLCDMGMGEPEIGSVYISELVNTRVRGLPLERDRWFKASKSIVGYADTARAAGKIVA